MSMPAEKDAGVNDEFAWIEGASEDIYAAARKLIDGEEAGRISERAIRHLLTAAIRLYVARTDGEDRTFRPVMGNYDEELTATEVISACTELLRALRLSPMELSIWFRTRPDATDAEQGYGKGN